MSISQASVSMSRPFPLASKPELGARAVEGGVLYISTMNNVVQQARKIRKLFFIMIFGAPLYLGPTTIGPGHE